MTHAGRATAPTRAGIEGSLGLPFAQMRAIGLVLVALGSITTCACSRERAVDERAMPAARSTAQAPLPPAAQLAPAPTSIPSEAAASATPGATVALRRSQDVSATLAPTAAAPAATVSGRVPRSFDPVGYWTDRLEHGTPEERLAAAVGLGLSGAHAEQATAHLLTLLDDSDPVARRMAAEALGRLGAPSGQALSRVELLAADDPDADVRSAATQALAKFAEQADAPAAPGLASSAAASPASTSAGDATRAASRGALTLTDAMQQMSSNDEAARVRALHQASAFGALAAPAVGDIVRALRDDSAAVRREAAAALGRIGSSAAAPVGIVRATADSRALPPSAFGPNGEDAIDGLAALVEDDADPAVRLAAVHALAQVGLPASSAADELEEASREDAEVAVRDAAARALTAVGGR